MMMITFITINSGLVPLIEDVCAQILDFGFEIIGGLRHLLLFLFRKKKCVEKDFLGPPGVSSRLMGSHPSTPSVQCVCVCAYTHTYTHVHSHPR